MAKKNTPYTNKGKSKMLENVNVYSPKKEIDNRSKTTVSSVSTKDVKKYPINTPLPKISQVSSAPAPTKKMGRLGTAVSDYTSAVRTSANVALSGVKKEMPQSESKTKTGKVLERVGRVAGGIGGAFGAVPATYLGVGPAAVVAGQALYNKRDEASKKRGLLNVGKNLDFTPGQLSGPSDSNKKQVRNSIPLGETQFPD